MYKTKEIKFKCENTAIDTNNSYTAKLVAEAVVDFDKVLDYGCGTGRNIRYIKENSSDKQDLIIDGCDIQEQLIRSSYKHDLLRETGSNIFNCNEVPNDHYNIVLNSHVLNVIPDDDVKQEVMDNIYRSLIKGGIAYIEVRTKADVEKAKHKTQYGDGWHILQGNTYQESISKEKMEQLALRSGFEIKKHYSNSSRHYLILQK